MCFAWVILYIYVCWLSLLSSESPLIRKEIIFLSSFATSMRVCWHFHIFSFVVWWLVNQHPLTRTFIMSLAFLSFLSLTANTKWSSEEDQFPTAQTRLGLSSAEEQFPTAQTRLRLCSLPAFPHRILHNFVKCLFFPHLLHFCLLLFYNLCQQWKHVKKKNKNKKFSVLVCWCFIHLHCIKLALKYHYYPSIHQLVRQRFPWILLYLSSFQ